MQDWRLLEMGGLCERTEMGLVCTGIGAAPSHCYPNEAYGAAKHRSGQRYPRQDP